MKHLNKGQYDKAISDFTKSIEIHPSAEAYYRRGIAYIAYDDKYRGSGYNEHVKHAIFEKSKGIWSAEALDGLRRKRNAYLDKAISDFNKAIEINPTAEAYSRRGIAYEDKAHFELFLKRIIVIKKHIIEKKKIDPKSFEANSRRGIAYENKAIFDYNKAIEVNPEYPEGYEFRSMFYEQKGQIEKAKADDNRAMERFYWRAISYQLKSQYEKACSDYRRACELGSEAACDEIYMFEERGFFCQQTQSWIIKIKSNRVIQ